MRKEEREEAIMSGNIEINDLCTQWSMSLLKRATNLCLASIVDDWQEVEQAA